MIKNQDKLAERLKGIKVGDKDLTLDLLKELLTKTEETELIIPNVHLLDDTQLESVKTTVREDQKTKSYAEGKTAGEEMLIKAFKKNSGLDYEGKDPEKFLSELTAKIEKEKGIEPNKKITELQESIKNLQKTAEEKDQSVKAWEKKYTDFEKNIKLNSYSVSKMPKNLKGITPEQLLTLFKAEGYTPDYDESGNVVTLFNGKVLKNNLEKAVPHEEILLDFAKKNNWINGDGRGDGDGDPKNTGKFKSMNELMAHMEKNKINPASQEGLALQKEFEDSQAKMSA